MSAAADDDPRSTHRVIDPSVLYLGTPVYLVGTLNTDGTTNIAPASSHFALGRVIVLGLETGGQSLENARRHGEITVNFLASNQWQHVERLAGVTGKHPVPDEKLGQYTYEPLKFARAGLSAAPADLVAVDLVADAPIQLEARVLRITPGAAGLYGIVEAEVVRVHAARDMTVEGTNHIDPEAWHPLIYAYRHFYDRGAEVGWTRKSPLVTVPDSIDRWVLSGGGFRVASVTDHEATVELLRCDGGEVADTLVLRQAREIRWALVQAAANG